MGQVETGITIGAIKFIAIKTTENMIPPPRVVVDQGYAESCPSCGVWWENLTEQKGRQFYRAVAAVTEGLNYYLKRDLRPLLIVEAPLSRGHAANGNPTCRGPFEEGRNWYRQPGAGIALGAQRLLENLAEKLLGDVWIAEAFLSNKGGEDTPHWRDAQWIFDNFWNAPPMSITAPTVDPLSPLITSIPEVRVFSSTNAATASMGAVQTAGV